MNMTVTFNSYADIEEFVQKFGAPIKEAAPIKETAPIKEAAPAKVPEQTKPAEEKPAPEKPAEEKPAPESKKIGETEAKLLLSSKLKAGKKQEVKDLFTKYGVEKLSELISSKPESLPQFYADAEVI